eukprot:TRINITY_DN774101_c0_g1_i1.p1 TRINITY_DN774101_c0_g1~~TRINITY_DN774101_c0_g1_i1.p1  ORF type:complete len:558 (-),score=78.58 TRINITY_DN774101_c0_g1_i1:79-1752(-)
MFRVSRFYLVICIIFRILDALVVKTEFHPDETWQSVEIAHFFMFRTGHRTWEWHDRIRSFLHPSIFAGLFGIMDTFGLCSASLITVSPRLLQGLIAGFTDYISINIGTFILSKRTHSVNWPFLLSFATLANWFSAFVMVRTYSNSFATFLFVLALWIWLSVPAFGQLNQQQLGLSDLLKLAVAVSIGGFTVMIRPPTVILWFILFGYSLYLLRSGKDQLKFVLLSLVSILFVVFSTIIIDSLFYGKLTILTVWNFLEFNVFSGQSVMFGSHPWHWYFSQGLWAVLVAFSPFVIYGIFMSFRDSTASLLEKMMSCMVIVMIGGLSIIGHKEFRFLTILTPLFTIMIALSLWRLSRLSYIATIVCMIAIVLIHSFVFILLGVLNQSGPSNLLPVLHERLEARNCSIDNCEVHFIMPCHAFPLQSHLHDLALGKFLHCDPQYRMRKELTPSEELSNRLEVGSNSFVETYYLPLLKGTADDNTLQLFHGFDPHTRFVPKRLPEMIVMYENHMSDELLDLGYKLVTYKFHSLFNGDFDDPHRYKYIVLLEREFDDENNEDEL